MIPSNLPADSSYARMTCDKPYRPNVGIALFNTSGQVLIGRRFRDDGPEIILPGLEWQMPQGGIDADENPRDAVMRELWEETGAVSAEHLGETDGSTYESRYEFPPYDGDRRTSPRPAPKYPRPARNRMVRAALQPARERASIANPAERRPARTAAAFSPERRSCNRHLGVAT